MSDENKQFIEALIRMPLRKRAELFSLLAQHPQLLNQLKIRFNQKVSTQNGNQLKDIYQQEQAEIDKLIAELKSKQNEA